MLDENLLVGSEVHEIVILHVNVCDFPRSRRGGMTHGS